MTAKMRKIVSLVQKPRKEPVFHQHEYEEFMELLYKVRKIFEYHENMKEQNRELIRFQNDLKRIEAHGLEITKQMAKRQEDGRLGRAEVDKFLRSLSDSEPASS